MPYADQVKSEDKLLRTFIYGEAKAKKTWWACRCAELGFNVILLDGDDGALIVDQLPLAARKRILVVDLVMRTDRTVMTQFMAKLLRPENVFLWDEQDHNPVIGLTKATNSYIQFDQSKFGSNDVIVLDGWKALSESTMFEFAKEKKIDLSDAEKTEWNGYNYQGNFLNWVLARLHALPCHLIVIGHSTIYEKWDRRSPNPKEHKLIETRTQPISSSGPHAKKLASHFTDVLFFERLSSVAYKIHTAGDRDRDGGSRLFGPSVEDWDKFGPDKFFDKLGWKPTGEPCKGAIWYAPGQEIPRMGIAAKLAVVQQAAPAQAQTALAAPPVIQNAGGIAARIAGLKKGGG